MMIQYCLDVLSLGKGDGACISVMDDVHVEYPARFSEVCGRKNGGDLFLEEHDNCKGTSVLFLTSPICKGNLTDLRRILHLSLAKGNPK
jgi:hypothetical protein